jgi:succinate dehydrogenase/fumarate reductase flavoprotein subunit
MPREVDLLVLGAGAAGMTAALVGSINGLDVLVCEKAGQLGGTTATSAGTVWIPENRENICAGFTGDSRQAAGRYLDHLIDQPEHGRAARESFLAHGPDVLTWLAQHTDVKFLPCGDYPDYLDEDGAATRGRTVIPEPFDGRLLGDQFHRVRPPITEFMVLGGMMVGKADIPHLLNRFKSLAAFRYSAGLFLRFLADRLKYPRGTRLMLGNALVARLFYSLVRRKVPIAFETQLDTLLMAQGKVVGATLRRGEQSFQVLARKGVVLATGGFGRNPALRNAFMSPAVKDSMTVPENQGDGIAAALQIKALTMPERHGSGAFWSPVSRTGSGTWAGLYPHLAMDRAKPGLIAVNAQGQRFVNEAVSYHHFTLAMFETHKAEPASPVWLICEAGFVCKYGLGAIHPGTTRLKPYATKGWIVMADSLALLARGIGVDAANLQASVIRHNHFAVSGIDEDFAKGSTALNRYNGDASNQPNPCLAPIVKGPFCAMAVWPAEIGTSTGLEADAHGRVLNQQGEVIEGLYACGNDLASVMRGTYPGPGTTLGPALVFGYLVSTHATASSQVANPASHTSLPEALEP